MTTRMTHLMGKGIILLALFLVARHFGWLLAFLVYMMILGNNIEQFSKINANEK